MTEERKVTVAELLARSGVDAESTPRRRRRRRSLEDGGISVAELTGSLPRVEATPADSRHSAQPLEDELVERPEPTFIESAVTEDAEVTGAIAVVPEPAASAAPTATDDLADAEVTGKISVVPDEEPHAAVVIEQEPPAGDEDAELPLADLLPPVAEEDDEPEVGEEDDAKTSMGPVLLMAVVGIVIGAVIFVGFQYLWNSGLSNLIVAVLALAVTGVLVGLAHALRTARDSLSMVLAGVVGLLMTFGPGVVVLL